MASQKIQDFYARYAGKNYDQLCEDARKRLKIVHPYLVERVGEKNASTFLLYVLGILVGADGRLAENELTFIREMVDASVTRQRIENLAYQVSTPSYRATVDKIIDEFGPVLKMNLVMFCLCFLAVDGSIDQREATYFEKLIQ